jgi:hypothetical protein
MFNVTSTKRIKDVEIVGVSLPEEITNFAA